MSHSILITGASGYLGGSLLAHLRPADLPPHSQIFALVRSAAQAEAVKQYGATPLMLDPGDQDSVTKCIVNARITIIYFLVDAINSEFQISMIKALGEVKKQTGQQVHFLHTSGAKLFSEHAGFPTSRPILDTDMNLYDLQKTSRPPHAMLAQALNTNNIIIETAESYGVRSYIFIPCVVYGKGEGFGNRISIQTTAIVQVAKKVGAVYDINSEGAVFCHIKDTTALYISLLKSILSEANPDYGKNGYYLAASGSVAWKDIYAAMAKSLVQRKVIDQETVTKADDAAIVKMALALQCPKELVSVQLGGTCTLQADRAFKLGWSPEFLPEHILEVADSEVALILENLKD